MASNILTPPVTNLVESYGACDGVVAKALTEQNDAYIGIVNSAALIVMIAVATFTALWGLKYTITKWLKARRTRLRNEIISELSGINLDTVHRITGQSSAGRAKQRLVDDKHMTDVWEQVENDREGGLGEK